MPRYEYECEKCGTFEVIQSIDDEELEVHDECGEPVKRIISRSTFILAGGGWYSDGYSTGKQK